MSLFHRSDISFHFAKKDSITIHWFVQCNDDPLAAAHRIYRRICPAFDCDPFNSDGGFSVTARIYCSDTSFVHIHIPLLSFLLVGRRLEISLN